MNNATQILQQNFYKTILFFSYFNSLKILTEMAERIHRRKVDCLNFN